MLREDQIERYARHILLREVGGIGQERLLASEVEIRGLGAAGGWAAAFLALAGVGSLRLYDPKPVEAAILPWIGPDAVGERRDEAWARAIAAHNPDVRCVALEAPAEAQWRLSCDEGSEPTGSGGLWLRTLADGVVLGWPGDGHPPCDVCLGVEGGERGEPRHAMAAWAGSFAAGQMLSALLEIGSRVEGFVRYDATGSSQLPVCSHR